MSKSPKRSLALVLIAGGITSILLFQNFSLLTHPVKFMMVSGYQANPLNHQYDPSQDSALDSQLSAMAQAGVAGVIYESIGLDEENFALSYPFHNQANHYGVYDAVLYNQGIFNRAKLAGASLWLQVEVPYNYVYVGDTFGATPQYDKVYDPASQPKYPTVDQYKSGSPFKNLSAEDILGPDEYSVPANVGNYSYPLSASDDAKIKSQRKAFGDRFKRGINAYAGFNADGTPAPFHDKCVVILFEEETLYHSKQGGGGFWAGSAFDSFTQTNYVNGSPAIKAQDLTQNPPINPTANAMFVSRFSRMYRLLKDYVDHVNPNCQVGIHIGHQPLYQPVSASNPAMTYQQIVANVSSGADGHAPDFTFYDLYMKITKPTATKSSFEIFQSNLTKHVGLIREANPGKPVYQIAQLHTSGDFGGGMARTPTLNDLNNTLVAWSALNLEGVGFYTKDSTATNPYCFGPAANVCTSLVTTNCCPYAEDLNPYEPNYAPGMLYKTAPANSADTSLQRWYKGVQLLQGYQGVGEN